MTPEFRSTAPDQFEYAPYYGKYITAISHGDILTTLSDQVSDARALFSGLSDEQAMYSYAPEKWNIKEILGHVIDAERVFAYRALRIARADRTALASFEHDDYVKVAKFSQRPLPVLLTEFEHVRAASVDLFTHLDDEAWSRKGTASGFAVSVRALAWIIAGHELHHRRIIQARYLKSQ
ncbi:MAG: DinB family protein [Candidatus Zixiibacteriota bacterium]